jgi:hypothetical protein
MQAHASHRILGAAMILPIDSELLPWLESIRW